MDEPCENLSELFTTGVVATLIDLIKIVGLFVALFWVSSNLALVLLLAGPLLIVVTWVFQRKARAGLSVVESDLIGVELPDDPQPLMRVCTALLQAEVNIVQIYPLLVRPRGRPAIALLPDDMDMAKETLARLKIKMLVESDLEQEG